MRSGQAMLLPSMSPEFLRVIAQSGGHFELMRRAGYHSAIVVPLVARGRTLGALSLLRMLDAPPYDRDDLLLAEELARRAALAVDNARLYESTRQLARTLQQSLLPHTLPAIPGARVTARYRAAEREHEVGGDFYDVFPLDTAGWGVTIGDVCGKGADAAALTAFARYTIRALATADAGAVIARLNDAVIRERQSEKGRFLTAVFAAFFVDGDRLSVEVAAGGHPPPLIIRRGQIIEPIRLAGPMIGLDARAEFPAARLALCPGETIVLYTDGLTDAQAPQRILTEDDLAEMLGRAAGLEGERLAAFIEQSALDGGAARDDIALLVIEFLGACV
jgi:serine phosphatase RsbU (regulator of sigma subunit)